MYPMSRLVKSIVEEKELKMREVMKIMGLRDWAHQGAWFITAFILFFWIAISSTFIAHISFLPKTDPSLLFLFFFTFALSEITFSFLIASFFSKAKLAAMVAPVVLFAAILPRFIFYSSNPYEQQQSKYLASLLSPTAFTFGADILANYEYAGIGVQVYNMDQGLYSFSGALRMMFADFIIYGVLAWYLDQVIPLDVGTPKHPLFIFHLSYWFPVWSRRNLPDFEFSQPLEFNPSSSLETSSIQYLPESERQRTQVLISHLRKRYADGKLAVKDFSLALLEGQITCLLGHNGAGTVTPTSTILIVSSFVRENNDDLNPHWAH
jgi:ATP-binding cassette, subfamily A (ABC1), member 3